MIQLTRGDLFASDAEALVNPVNCVGVMGKGLAAEFKRIFPAGFRAYAAACRRNEVAPGKMFVFPTGLASGPQHVICFPTKRHWRDASRLEDIEVGLVALAELARSRPFRSIAIPPLGCGLGGLQWDEVRPRIESTFSSIADVRAVVFEPAENRRG